MVDACTEANASCRRNKQIINVSSMDAKIGFAIYVTPLNMMILSTMDLPIEFVLLVILKVKALLNKIKL